VEEEALAALVARTLDDDVGAWKGLWLALDPLIEDIARSPKVMGRLAACPDARRDVVVRVMGELREDGFRRLAELGERLACRDRSYRPWLWAVTRNAAVSHVRAHGEYMRPVKGGAGGWVEHEPLYEEPPDDRLSALQQVEAHHILERSREVLAPAQREALGMWLQGDQPAEIAAALHQDGGGEAATRLVRSAVERLRVRFAKEQPAHRRRANKIDRRA
jgi:DNA-directed RNA polymerase specialized sigma24 family protein